MTNDRDPKSDLSVWLGEELRRVRIAAGFKSQDQLARKLGWERSVVAKAEQATVRRRPTLLTPCSRCSPTWAGAGLPS